MTRQTPTPSRPIERTTRRLFAWTLGSLTALAALVALAPAVAAEHQNHTEPGCYKHEGGRSGGWNGNGWYYGGNDTYYCCFADEWGYGVCDEYYCQWGSGSGYGGYSGCTKRGRWCNSNYDAGARADSIPALGFPIVEVAPPMPESVPVPPGEGEIALPDLPDLTLPPI